MEKQTGDLTMFRYELVHGDDAEFIAYQRQLGDGVWQTLSRWMIPARTVATKRERAAQARFEPDMASTNSFAVS
jgi:hypothetical protein